MLIPALLKVKLGASEMVCTLMLNYVLLYIVKHFLTNVFADRSRGQTQTLRFLDTAQIPSIVVRAKLTWGFFIAIACAALIWLFMYRTRWGVYDSHAGREQAVFRLFRAESRRGR